MNRVQTAVMKPIFRLLFASKQITEFDGFGL
jgi:hypothetical protein